MLITFINKFGNAFSWINGKKSNLDNSMQAVYSPKRFAVFACACVMLLITILLFIPPYVGMSNDGSFESVLKDAGLRRIDESSNEEFFNYYERLYIIEGKSTGSFNPLAQMLKLAVWLDTVVTQDDVFDMRVLAMIYALLYIAALYPVALHCFKMVSVFSEGTFVLAAIVIIFGDASYVVYMASLYKNHIILIGIIGAVGTLLTLSQKGFDWVKIIMLTIFVCMLMWANPMLACAGIVFAFLCIELFFISRDWLWRGLCIFLSILLFTISIFSFVTLRDDNWAMRKYHTMTRGVLLQSQDPETILGEFGISKSYSILADTYANVKHPFVDIKSGVLDDGFLKKYTTLDIIGFYMQRPDALVSMMSTGIKASFSGMPSYSGNFEMNSGHKPGQKIKLWSLWSTFKSQSAPQTVGFLLALALITLLLYNKEGKGIGSFIKADKRDAVKREVMTAISFFAIAHLITVIIVSGDSEMVDETFVTRIIMDMLVLFLLCGILHKVDAIRKIGVK